MSVSDFDNYQNKAVATAVFPSDIGLVYTALGVANEAGELVGKVKKHCRGDYDISELKSVVVGEVGDVLWYLAALCQELGISLGDAAQYNLDKLADRAARGVLKGNGDNR